MILKPHARVVRDLLVPSFLRSDTNPLRPTSWLDGLRGWAALAVVIGHFSNNYFSSVNLGYGVPLHHGERKPWYNVPHGANKTHITDETLIDNKHVLQLPFLRLLAYGDPMVAIFFVVSGYSLSLKQISLARQGASSRSGLLQSLSSSIIRRPIRLFLPGFISTLILALVVGFGMTTTADNLIGDAVRHGAKLHKTPDPFWLYFRGWTSEGPPKTLPSMTDQLWDWYSDMYKSTNPFTSGTGITFPYYDGHLWTIPIEYKCSILLFVTQLTLAAVTTRKRLMITTTLAVSALCYVGRWPMACFWAGMLICEFDMMFLSPSTPILRHRLAWVAAAIFGAYLMSYPANYPERTPWSWPVWAVISWLPGDQKRIPHTIGACLVTAAVSSHASLGGFFSNGLSRYLGRISFAIYLVHGPMWRTLGHYTTIRLLGPDAHELSDYSYHRACIYSFLSIFPIILYLSDMFTRLVDEPVVRFARSVEMWITKDDQIEEMREEHKIPLLPVAITDMDEASRRDSTLAEDMPDNSRARASSRAHDT